MQQQQQQHLFNATFQDTSVSWYQNVSILDFNGAKDDGSGGDNWSYQLGKAPVKTSPPTNKTKLCFFCHPTNSASMDIVHYTKIIRCLIKRRQWKANYKEFQQWVGRRCEWAIDMLAKYQTKTSNMYKEQYQTCKYLYSQTHPHHSV